MNAPARHIPTTQADIDAIREAALEHAIASVSAYQAELGDNRDAYEIHDMVLALKARRTPETVARLDAERLARASGQ
ncbi:MAG TPA: hypothetical protein DDW98_13490 [Gammaproteobacteria bacterium]|jgi:hypothetical protein|nr:hypothetical protein [Gammaproteobacteria bacterium]